MTVFFSLFLFFSYVKSVNFEKSSIAGARFHSLVNSKAREVQKAQHLLPCRAVSLGAPSPAAVGDVSSTALALACRAAITSHGVVFSERDGRLAGFVDQDFAVVDEQLVVHGPSQILHLFLDKRDLQDLPVQLLQKSTKRKFASGIMALRLQTVELVLVRHNEVRRGSKVIALHFLPSLQLARNELGLVVQAQQPDCAEDFVGVGEVV